MMDQLPEPGTEVVRYRPFSGPHFGEVVGRHRWSHGHELKPTSFIVEYQDLGLAMHRIARGNVEIGDEKVVVGRKHK